MSLSKIFLNIFLIFLFIGLEESGLAGKFFINPLVCLIIFCAVDKNNFYFIWPLMAGPILDFYSVFSFPVFTFSFLLVFLAIKFISDKVLTFKNYLSYIIFAVAGILLYNIIFVVINFLAYLLRMDNFLVVFNNFYFLHLLFNTVLIFLLLVIFRKKYDRSILYSQRG
jgi:hypothetical protein